MIRKLTEGERELARHVFDQALTLDRVRILAAPWPFTRAFVPGRWFGRDWIVWPRRALGPDLSADSLGRRATLVHELVHVWQAQQGVNLLFAKLKAGDGRAAYAYPLEACVFDGLNIEQQASAVEHAYRLAEGGKAPGGRAFYSALLPFTCAWDRPVGGSSFFDARC